MQVLGRRNRPFYRICAIDQRARRNGPVLENLGIYDPINPKASEQVRLNEERIKHWLSKGAVATDTVRDIFAKHGLVNKAEWEKDREHDRKRMAESLARKAAQAEKGEKKEEKKA
jgi:small subunit ribosomal protein S16